MGKVCPLVCYVHRTISKTNATPIKRAIKFIVCIFCFYLLTISFTNQRRILDDFALNLKYVTAKSSLMLIRMQMYMYVIQEENLLLSYMDYVFIAFVITTQSFHDRTDSYYACTQVGMKLILRYLSAS